MLGGGRVVMMVSVRFGFDTDNEERKESLSKLEKNSRRNAELVGERRWKEW